MAKFEYDSEKKLRLANDLRLSAQRPWLDAMPSDFSTILDVGAGDGSHCRYFYERGLKPTALDVQPVEFPNGYDIEHICSNIRDLDQTRKFDAIFLSHVVEHFSNLERGLHRLRRHLNSGGYLFIVVPPYEPIVCDNHWQTGWNCAQLAVVLVACGFDCSGATFAELGTNVCGWGKIRDLEFDNEWSDQGFDIERCSPYLPAAMRARITRSPAGNVHLPDLVFCDQAVATARAARHVFDMPGLRLGDAALLRFGLERSSRDFILEFDPPIDVVAEKLQLAIVNDGRKIPIRVAISSDVNVDGERLTNLAETYIGNNVGVAAAELMPQVFASISGSVDFRKVRWICCGGVGDNARVSVWISLGEESLTADKNQMTMLFGGDLSDRIFVLPQDFDLTWPSQLQYGQQEGFEELLVKLDVPLDLTVAALRLLVHCEGECVPALRVAVDSGVQGEWLQSTEHYLTLQGGYTFIELDLQTLQADAGMADLSLIRRISVGGMGREAKIHVWVTHGATRLHSHRNF